MIVWNKECVAAHLKISVRTLLRYTQETGKQKTRLGSKLRFVFSEKEVEELKQIRDRNQGQTVLRA